MKAMEALKPIRFEGLSFGSIRIDGVTYEHDVMIDRGEVRKRKKKPSKKFRDTFGHTPLSVEEKIPWKCRRLVHRHRDRCSAGHGRSKKGSQAPPRAAAHAADSQGN